MLSSFLIRWKGSLHSCGTFMRNALIAAFDACGWDLGISGVMPNSRSKFTGGTLLDVGVDSIDRDALKSQFLSALGKKKVVR